EAERGDDAAVQGPGGESARRLPPHAPADPGPDRPLLGTPLSPAPPALPGEQHPPAPDQRRGQPPAPGKPVEFRRDEPALQRAAGGPGAEPPPDLDLLGLHRALGRDPVLDHVEPGPDRPAALPAPGRAPARTDPR